MLVIEIMKKILCLIAVVFSLDLQCEGKSVIDPVYNASLSEPNFHIPFPYEIGYKLTKLLVDLPGNIKKYLHGAGQMTEHIKKDFVGFIQANLAIPYGIFYWAKIDCKSVRTPVGDIVIPIPPELLIIFPIAAATMGAGRIRWDEPFQHFFLTLAGSFMSGVAAALKDSDMGYVVDIIKKAFKETPLRDFKYLFEYINERLRSLECTDVFTESVCRIPELERKIENLIGRSGMEYFIPDTRESVKISNRYLGGLHKLFSSFVCERFGNDFQKFVNKSVAKFKEFQPFHEKSNIEDKVITFNLSREIYVRDAEPVYSCDHYTPETVPSLCRFFQLITRLMTDFSETVQLFINTVTRISVRFMESILYDFSGYVKSGITPIWAWFRYTEVIRSAVTSKRVGRFASKWFPMMKLFTMLPAMAQARKIFDMYALLESNLFTGIKAGLVDSGLKDLIPLVEKYQRSTIQPFVHTLEIMFQKTKCSDIFPASFCNIAQHRKSMQEIWDFVLHGKFARDAKLTLKIMDERVDRLSAENRARAFFQFCAQQGREDECKAFVLPMNEFTQDGVNEVKDFVEWLIHLLW